MPSGDGTGPLGLGPMTGRAAGYCAGYSVPGYMNPIPGRGRGWFGFGRGGGRGFGWSGCGRGWRHWYWATGLPGWARVAYGHPAFGGWIYPYYGPNMTPEEEMDMLRNHAESLRQGLNDIQNRISTLKKAQAEGEKGK
ncbi:MAG: hypothetical protein B6D56_02050 [Candidatus Omnitrophica bacterium 4484_70.1]|nr:MAG: hypothetical protein B6D56_02050 [Candidatus Omnitrophica bacterium 4484_70.1]